MKQILTISLLFAASFTFAQNSEGALLASSELEASVTNDLAALNAHFSGMVEFRIDKRDRLVAKYLSGANADRTDLAHFDFLDASTCAYSENERALILQCQDPRSKCIEQQMQKSGAPSATGHMSLPLPNSDASGEKARTLLTKLVETKQNAELARLAEANTPHKR
jgi:hypothetical protein